MADIETLQRTLGVPFNLPSLLEQALIHSSYVNENPGIARISNERLEFLGDAVLGLVVAEKLYEAFPEFTEGEMTRLRATVVRRETLARVAHTIGLGDYLYLGKGEEASGGRYKAVTLAGALEAVIAAIYLDQDLKRVREFILRFFDDEIQRAVTHSGEIDYKSKLQELSQAKLQQTPAYYVLEATGPDHDRHFTVEVRAGGTVLARGKGRSKKLAEADAARSALHRLSLDFTR
ncbi:MAG: ribonuclease III [Chloroflexi bacterium]|nr:ribonuclease III [Chloroflexota bacterium]